MDAESTQKAQLHGGCLSLEGLSGPEPQLLARQSKFTSHLIKNLGLSPGTHPRQMQWRGVNLHSPSNWGDILQRPVLQKHLLGSVLWAPARSWTDLGPLSACWGGLGSWDGDLGACIDKLGLCPKQLQAGVPPPAPLEWPSPVGGCQLGFSSSITCSQEPVCLFVLA